MELQSTLTLSSTNISSVGVHGKSYNITSSEISIKNRVEPKKKIKYKNYQQKPKDAFNI